MTSGLAGRIGPALVLQPDTRVRFVTDGAEGVIAATIAHGSPHPVEYDVRLVGDDGEPGPADVDYWPSSGPCRLRVPAVRVYPLPVDLDRVAELRLLHGDAAMMGEALLAEVMWRRELLDMLLTEWRDLPEYPRQLAVEAAAPGLATMLDRLDRLDEQWRTYKPGDLVRVAYISDESGLSVSYWARVQGPAARRGDYNVEVVHVGPGSAVKVGDLLAPIRGVSGSSMRFVPAASVPEVES